jgi:ATP-dependent helicase/nuclease subunit A
VRKANLEQQNAIEHDGGVLLKAGAGSGKTFVLVEHMIFRAHQLYLKNPEIKVQEIEENFSKIVLMTFTNLAANEIRVRLFRRFEEQITSENKDEGEFWQLALSVLDRINVTTIHGFCYKIISMGFIPHLSLDTKILDEEDLELIIEKIISQFVEQELNTINNKIFEFDYKEFVAIFKKIWVDPEMRLEWDRYSINQSSPHLLDLNLFDDVYGWRSFLKQEKPFLDPDLKNLKWYQYFDYLFRQSFQLNSWEDLIRIHHFFQTEEGKLTRKPSGKNVPNEIIDYFLELKKFKESITLIAQSYLDYSCDYEGKIKPWLTYLKNAYDFLSIHYPIHEGIGFSDLEYEVFKSLENQFIAENISHYFNYFVVDEFQDTSQIQFSIIKKLILNDYNRLFCIGDPKQAIYGFRGGELDVFKQAMDLMPTVLDLKLNYRSESFIINFNNNLFQDLFKLGESFEGIDRHTVVFDRQLAPTEDSIDKDKVKFLEINVAEESYVNAELFSLEAQAIADYIQSEESNKEQIAILYKTLQPSNYLIRELIKRQISFRAQLKLDFNEDPLIGLFKVVLDHLLLPQFSIDYTNLKLNSLLMAFGFKERNYLSELEKLKYEVEISGINFGFKSFLLSLNFSHTFSFSTLMVIEKIIENHAGDLEKIHFTLSQGKQSKIQHMINWGDSPDRVLIMSCHASKGLEFKEVILGDITLQRLRSFDFTSIGVHPGALKWKNNQLEKMKSPMFLLEDAIDKLKDFSESKRLFYVANTRAETSLVIPMFKNDSIDLKSSWVNGLRKCLASLDFKKVESDLSSFVQETFVPPFFYQHPLGVLKKSQDSFPTLALTGDLSVTKISKLLDCPFKFYLKDILKISPLKSTEHFEQKSLPSLSSSERGTLIHSWIHYSLNHNFTLPREIISNPEEELMTKVVSLIKEHEPNLNKIKSEFEIKFPLFGFVILGILDLFLPEKEEIWDFKTGRRDPEAEKKYWMQLSFYAYGLYELEQIPKTKSIKLKLFYLDSFEVVEIIKNWNDIHQEVFNCWSLLGQLKNYNPHHCSVCEMRDICPYESKILRES